MLLRLFQVFFFLIFHMANIKFKGGKNKKWQKWKLYKMVIVWRYQFNNKWHWIYFLPSYFAFHLLFSGFIIFLFIFFFSFPFLYVFPLNAFLIYIFLFFLLLSFFYIALTRFIYFTYRPWHKDSQWIFCETQGKCHWFSSVSLIRSVLMVKKWFGL